MLIVCGVRDSCSFPFHKLRVKLTKVMIMHSVNGLYVYEVLGAVLVFMLVLFRFLLLVFMLLFVFSLVPLCLGLIGTRSC